MILKVGNGIEWHYVDGIKTLSILQPFELEQGQMCRNLTIPPLESDGVEQDQNIDVEEVHKIMLIDFGDGDATMYRVKASQIYLLSDIGKTIERIN